LQKQLEPISYHLIETLNDLIIAFPDNQKDFIEARSLIQAVYATTLNAIDELKKNRMCE
jgi:hypothetical protein